MKQALNVAYHIKPTDIQLWKRQEQLRILEGISLLTGYPIEDLKKKVDQVGIIGIFRYLDTHNVSPDITQKLRLISQLYEYVEKDKMSQMQKLHKLSDVVSYLINLYKLSPVEQLLLIMLDSSNNVLEIHNIYGSFNEVLISIRELVKITLNRNAVNVILSHNHLSGETAPSRQDIVLTQKLRKAFETVEITLLDHIVVSNTKFYSFAEHQWILCQ